MKRQADIYLDAQSPLVLLCRDNEIALATIELQSILI
jgi:hypothetical protein